MSKQTVTGVAEGHLLHKDFLVEYDPDERTWTVEREVPAEPTPEPGTAGTATVLHTTNVHGFCHLAGPEISGTFAFTSDEGVTVPWRDVTDFEPDPKPGVIPDAIANAIAANWQARLDEATREAARMKALADSQTDIATKALDDRDAAEERARLAERDARAEHAEVETLRGQLADRSNDARRYLEESRDYKKSAELNKGAADSARAEVERLRATTADQWPFKPGDVVHSNGPTADAEWLDVAPDGTKVKDAAGTVWTVGGTGKYWCDSPGGRHLRSAALLDGYGQVTVVSVPGAPEPRPAFVLYVTVTEGAFAEAVRAHAAGVLARLTGKVAS